MSKIPILLIGKIGSGKSLVAGILKKYGFREETFSSPIKMFAKSIGFLDNQIYGSQQDKLEINNFWNISGREFLQQFGTDLCRKYFSKCVPNMNMGERKLWTRIMEFKIGKGGLMVISDGRFEDEAKLIKDYGGIIIEIKRYQKVTDTEEKKFNQLIHSSELSNIIPDYTINNDGTIQDIKDEILNIICYEESILSYAEVAEVDKVRNTFLTKNNYKTLIKLMFIVAPVIFIIF
jgi:hypothetical protein